MTFIGSGDVKSGATAYWNTSRAYTAAYASAGGPLMDLVDQAGANSITINALSSGAVDLSSIASWVAAHSVTTICVAKLYDQTGNGHHVVQSTLANMPALKLVHPGFGNTSGLLCMEFVRSASQTLSSVSSSFSNSAGTFSFVARSDSLENSSSGVVQAGATGSVGWFRDVMQIYGGNNAGTTAPSDAFTAMQVVFNGTSSFVVANGVQGSTINPGTGPLTSPFTVGLWAGFAPFQGHISEIRFDGFAWAISDCVAEYNNQVSFWFTRASYEGIVASRCRAVGASDTTNKYAMSRSAHFATDTITALKIAVDWSYSGATVTASVEYPAGTFTQLKFGGSTSVALGSGLTAFQVFTDYATVSIPKGAQFWIRQYIDGSAGGGIRYSATLNSFLGEAVTTSATSLTDQTMSGTVVNTGSLSGAIIPPVVIVGVTSQKTVLVTGDSIAAGQADVEDTSSSNTGYNNVVGYLNRSIDAMGLSFLGLAFPGSGTVGGNDVRYQKCSHIIAEYSINDFQFGGLTSSQVISALHDLTYFFGSGVAVLQTTTTPYSNSSDSFATVTNQSQKSSFVETNRVAFNTALRGATTGILRLNAVIDDCTIIESSSNSNRWIASPTPPYTPDGIHPSQSAHTLLVSSGIVATAMATVPGSLGASNDNAVVSSTLGALASSATAVTLGSAVVSQTLGVLTCSATGTARGTASAGVSLGAVTSSATAAVNDNTAVAGTLGTLTSSAAAIVKCSAVLSQTLGALIPNATVSTGSANATAAITLGLLTCSAVAQANDNAQAAGTLGALTSSAQAAVVAAASASIALGALAVVATATEGTGNATASVTLGQLLGAGSSAVKVAAQAAVTLGALRVSAQASSSVGIERSARLATVQGEFRRAFAA